MLLKKLKDSVSAGASSGIGRATALQLAQQGSTVVVAARRQPALGEVAEECERLGARALAIAIDVSDEEAVPIGAAHHRNFRPHRSLGQQRGGNAICAL